MELSRLERSVPLRAVGDWEISGFSTGFSRSRGCIKLRIVRMEILYSQKSDIILFENAKFESLLILPQVVGFSRYYNNLSLV